MSKSLLAALFVGVMGLLGGGQKAEAVLLPAEFFGFFLPGSPTSEVRVEPGQDPLFSIRSQDQTVTPDPSNTLNELLIIASNRFSGDENVRIFEVFNVDEVRLGQAGGEISTFNADSLPLFPDLFDNQGRYIAVTQVDTNVGVVVAFFVVEYFGDDLILKDAQISNDPTEVFNLPLIDTTNPPANVPLPSSLAAALSAAVTLSFFRLIRRPSSNRRHGALPS
ncbi:MAG: hypothetical protein AAF968_03745 [Pseudomonadota bacterium]